MQHWEWQTRAHRHSESGTFRFARTRRFRQLALRLRAPSRSSDRRGLANLKRCPQRRSAGRPERRSPPTTENSSAGSLDVWPTRSIDTEPQSSTLSTSTRWYSSTPAQPRSCGSSATWAASRSQPASLPTIRRRTGGNEEHVHSARTREAPRVIRESDTRSPGNGVQWRHGVNQHDSQTPSDLSFVKSRQRRSWHQWHAA